MPTGTSATTLEVEMLRKIRESQQEEGFTLIELLVVVIIIGILAAIAIPVFLSQRERAWRSAMQSDLRNGAVAMETYYTDEGTYSAAGLDEAFGFSKTVDVEVTAPVATVSEYCLEATHTKFPAETWSISPGRGLVATACATPPAG
jgi:type IV pilus assembly protein PilA